MHKDKTSKPGKTIKVPAPRFLSPTYRARVARKVQERHDRVMSDPNASPEMKALVQRQMRNLRALQARHEPPKEK